VSRKGYDMQIVEQNKDEITLKLSPLELEVLRNAMVRESASRRTNWNSVEPRFPEELMYHAVMKDTSDHIKVGVYKGIKTYQRWGILKQS